MYISINMGGWQIIASLFTELHVSPDGNWNSFVVRSNIRDYIDGLDSVPIVGKGNEVETAINDFESNFEKYVQESLTTKK